MDRPTLSDGYPVLVADVAHADILDFLDGVALSQGNAFLPLMFAPRSEAEHVLEVYVPASAQPQRYFAIPSGPPRAEGFPLRLRPYSAMMPMTTPVAAPTRSPGRETLVGTALAGGKLRLEGLIGAGAVGAVFRATHRELEKTVAVKVLLSGASASAEFCERFKAEAMAASRLDHKNLTSVIDFGQEPDGLLYLSMEYLDGRTLEEVLRAEGRLTPSRAVDVMTQVCAGLWHAHARGIIHRDIKPANIVLVAGSDDEGFPMEVVKVCDFGVAIQRTDGGAADISGTPAYMAPEVLLGQPADGRTDLYACGVMLFELVTGKLPFDDSTMTAVARAHLRQTPPRPSEVSPGIDPALDAIILKALAKAPQERFASVRELRQALRESAPPLGATNDRVPSSSREPSSDPLSSKPNSGRAAWVEDASASFDSFMMAAASADGSAYHEGELLAGELAKAPIPYLEALAARRGEPTFADEVDRLEMTIAPLAKRGETTALACIVRVMSAIFAEEARRFGAAATAAGPGARALALLQSFAMPQNLKPLAERLLAKTAEPNEDLWKVMTWAQGAGAKAAYEARLKHHRVDRSHDVLRARFVSLMRAIGAPAGPILSQALRQLLPKGETIVSDAHLAEDLLRALPPMEDHAVGDVLLAYARVSTPIVAGAALEALAFAWPERAPDLLRASLSSEEACLKVAALRGLRLVSGVDENVVRVIEALVDGSQPAPEEVRLVAAEALSAPTPAATAAAARISMNVLVRGSTVMALVRGARASDELVLACAQTALALSRPQAIELVRQRAQKSADPLKSKLLALVAK